MINTEKNSIKALFITISLLLIVTVQHVAIKSVEKIEIEKNEMNYVEKIPSQKDETNSASSSTNTDEPLKSEYLSYDTPSFFIVGCSKCGTGAIAHFLDAHSKLCYTGETYFFNKHYQKGYQQAADFYKNFTKKCDKLE